MNVALDIVRARLGRGVWVGLAALVVAFVAVSWGGWLLAAAVMVWGGMLLWSDAGRGSEREVAEGWPWLAWGAFLVLLAKDLIPVVPPSGATLRAIAWAPMPLGWPGSARNPTLGWGAAQLAALLAGWSLILLLRRYLAGMPDRMHAALRVWSVAFAVLGLAIATVCWRTPDYGQELFVGLVRNKNGAGSLVMLGVLVHALLADVARRDSRVSACLLHAAVAVALLWPLVQLKSWTALVGLAVGSAAYGIARLPVSFRSWLLVGGIGAGVALGLATLEPKLANRTVDMAADYRLEIWRDLGPLISRQPWFGHGLGAFESVYPLEATFALPLEVRLVHPDSSLAKCVVEWGVVPALMLGVGVLYGLRLALRAIRRAAYDPAAQSAGAIALALACAWGATGVTDVTWHRPESFLAGVVAVGMLAGAIAPRGAGLGGPVGVWAVGLALPLALVLAGWSDVVARGNLRWNGLDPESFWRRAEQVRVAGGAVAEQVRFFDAAVRLQHRSVAYPLAAARRLHPQDPEAAFGFWVEALQRAQGAAWDEMGRVLSEFPDTPAAYWQRVAIKADVDFLLLVSPPDERAAVAGLEQWMHLMRGRSTVKAAVARRFLQRVEAHRAWPLLSAAVDSLPVADRGFWRQTASLLRRSGDLAGAWRAAQRLMPRIDATALPPKSGLSHLPPEALVEVRAFGDLQHWMLQAGEAEAERKARILQRLMGVADAPVWFGYFLAAEQARRGDLGAAVDRVLAVADRLEAAGGNP